MATVNILNVTKQFGSQIILDGINLSIEKGEFVAVVGPSGCGKSSLLRLVSGLDQVSTGKILINDQCVNKIPAAQRDMAMVFQSYALYPHMTVYENMAYGLKMRRMKAVDIKKRVQEVAELLQLSEYLHRKPQALSGGQRQRVAMGRAIVRSPAVFLFDEPLSNLDAKLRTEMRHEIKKLHQTLNTTSLYVTHDQTEAMTLASRVVILNNGKIEQIDSPAALYQRPASIFVASFTGNYPMNFLSAKYDEPTRSIISDLGLSWPIPVVDLALTHHEEVLIGIRPEHLLLQTPLSLKNIPVHIDFIDDLGADKLIHVRSVCGLHRFSARISADVEISSQDLAIAPMIKKANLFNKKTGLRIGGWA